MNDSKFVPEKGWITWVAEGNNDSKSQFYSRKAHWPQGASGVTIGRGYDMKERTKEEVFSDLTEAGVSVENANLLKEGAGLTQNAAKDFVKSEKIKDIELTEEEQLNLFNIVYAFYESDAKRLCTKGDVVALYGSCNFDKLDQNIKDLIVDLRYRGDYTPNARSIIQKALLTQDRNTIKKALDRLPAAPEDRRTLRNIHIDKIVK